MQIDKRPRAPSDPPLAMNPGPASEETGDEKSPSAYRLHWIQLGDAPKRLAYVNVRLHHRWGWRYDVTTRHGTLTLSEKQWEKLRTSDAAEEVIVTGAYPSGLLSAAIEHGRIPLTQAVEGAEKHLLQQPDEQHFGLTKKQTQAHNQAVLQLQHRNSCAEDAEQAEVPA